MRKSVNHHIITVNRDLQAAYLRNEQPQNGRLLDEVGQDERELQPGRAMFLTTLDELYLTTADIGTLYVSALLPDGTLAAGLSIAYSNGAYRITTSTDQTLWNMKVWTDNLATLEDKEAVLFDAIPANLYAWMKLDEGAGVFHYDSTGNGRHFQIPATVDLATHHALANVQYSWQNELGCTRFPVLAVAPADFDFDLGGGVVEGNGIKGTLTSDPAYYYFRIVTLTLGPHFAGDDYEAATGLPLPLGVEVKVDLEILDTNYPSYSVPEGQFYMAGAAPNLASVNRQFMTTLGPFTATHFVGDRNASTHVNRVDFTIDTALNYTGYGGLYWKFGNVVVRPQTILPRDESNPGYDVLGNALTHPRRAKYHAIVNSQCGQADGISYLNTASMPSGAYVDSWGGTATVTADPANNRIDFTPGTMWNVVVKTWQGDVWAIYPLCEGGQCNYAIDVSGQAHHATITSGDLNYFWAQRQTAYSRLLTHGFTKWVHATEAPIRVPYDNNGNPIPFPYWTPTGYTHAGEFPAGKLTDSGDLVDFGSGVNTPWAALLLGEDPNLETYEFGDGLAGTKLHQEATAAKEEKFYFEKL